LRRPSWKSAAFLSVAVVAGLVTAYTPASAAPVTPAKATAGNPFLGDSSASRDKDNRAGAAAPNATQRGLAKKSGSVTWNAFGTPQSLMPARGAKAITTGLPADPEAAARQYLVQNQALFGIDAASVAKMDKVMVKSLGTGSVVLLRQRFGNLPAGHDGLVSVLVNKGSVVRVTSSLSRNTSAPEAATIDASAAYAAALKDAGLTADQAQPAPVTEVAVPMPNGPARAAYQVSIISKDTSHPTSFNTYVDARTGGVLVREDQVDFDSDNPMWAVFPATPPLSFRAGTDPRVVWCFAPASGCVKTVADPNSGQAWDVDLTTGQPTFTTSGNAAQDVVLWGAGTPATPATPSPDQIGRASCRARV